MNANPNQRTTANELVDILNFWYYPFAIKSYRL